MNPPQLVVGVSPLHGLACLESGCRPARASRPEPPSSFRKSDSRPRSGQSTETAGHVTIREHSPCHPVTTASTRDHEAVKKLAGHDLNAFLWTRSASSCVRVVNKASFH